ncbi:MAG: hypothetical protein PHV82_14160 [Victivallaceae bacterium]|nr:hypothetical protein [Victivallaceae bacterium]
MQNPEKILGVAFFLFLTFCTVNAAGIKNDSVKTNQNGDRYLLVPGVGKEEQSYSVTDCVERLQKYYNMNIDKSVLAQVAEDSTLKGRFEYMEKALKSAAVKCGFQIREILNFVPLIKDVKIMELIRKYNEYAQKAGKNEINVANLSSYNQMIRMADGDIMARAKVEYDPKGFKKFKLDVKASIDQGTPVLWGVMLGLLESPESTQKIGGQLCLIIGYNPQKNEVIYSDSLREGYEFKRISWERAWAITGMAYALTPQAVRKP